MKSRFLLLGAFALLTSVASAQTAPVKKRTPEQLSAQLRQELGLSAEQTTRVEQIVAARTKEMKTMRSKATGSREERATAMKAVQAKYDAQLKKALTPQQYTQFIDWKPSRPANASARQQSKTVQ